MITLPMDKDTFAKLRRQLGLTRGELAHAMSLHERNIERFEAGSAPIPNWHAKLLIMFIRHDGGVPQDFLRSIPT
jgi:DNA-binding transcriptional regulator YiaG